MPPDKSLVINLWSAYSSSGSLTNASSVSYSASIASAAIAIGIAAIAGFSPDSMFANARSICAMSCAVGADKFTLTGVDGADEGILPHSVIFVFCSTALNFFKMSNILLIFYFLTHF